MRYMNRVTDWSLDLGVSLMFGGWDLKLPRSQLVQPIFDFSDRGFRRRCSGRHPDHFGILKPFSSQVLSRLNVMHSLAETAACLDQFMGVIAVRATDHHNHIRSLSQFDGRVLPLLRWLANCVDETDFGAGREARIVAGKEVGAASRAAPEAGSGAARRTY